MNPAALLAEPPVNLTLTALDAEGLQAPGLDRITPIVRCAQAAVALLRACAVKPPSESELYDLFTDFVLRAVNRAPGVGDAAAD